MHPIAEGAVKKIGFYRPDRIQVLPGTGKANKVPGGLKTPSYGEILIQHKRFGIIVDRPDDGDYKLYVDTNQDGDFTNDPPVTLSKKSQIYQPGTAAHVYYIGFARVKLRIARKKILASLGVYMFDKNDSQRAALKNQLLYYADFAEQGSVRFGKTKFDFVLSDSSADAKKPDAPGTQLLFDRHDDGRFGSRENIYALDKPFTLGDKTHEVQSVSFEKGRIRFVHSKAVVAEIPFPIRLVKGDSAIAFKTKNMAGDTVVFPEQYNHKIVLLDFWATWCGPCMAEVPNVLAAYTKYHDRGFDILGVSLDNEESSKQIPKVLKDKGMMWTQVCDKLFWNAAVAKLYNVHAIPQAYLVDGKSGKILAQGDELRGEGLAATLASLFPDPKPLK